MSTCAHTAGLEIVSQAQIAPPPAAKSKPNDPRSEIELEDLHQPIPRALHQSWPGAITPAGQQTPFEARTQPVTGAQTPHTSNGLESGTPVDANFTGIVPSFSYPKMNKWRVLCACLTYFGNGMNDSVPGALIPYMEKHYNIGYAIVSLIFVTNAIGFIITAFATDTVLSKLGRSRTLMTGEVIMLVGYVMIACTPPFPVVVVA